MIEIIIGTLPHCVFFPLLREKDVLVWGSRTHAIRDVWEHPRSQSLDVKVPEVCQEQIELSNALTFN